ncbi:MAG: hypothetical protein LBP38_02880 [Desulfovibrio sp.]|jgi:hypothetical protein|nr:hypothetical protein [Desulfovibrio sp.]
MDDKTKGAWLIHHTNKLQNVTSQTAHEEIYFAGKSGIFLSAISATQQHTLTNDQLKALAKASDINSITELPKIIEHLSERELVDTSQTGVDVLGLTTHAVLQHTSFIYESMCPNKTEDACLFLSEMASNAPIKKSDVAEKLSNEFHINENEIFNVFKESEQIGFTDYENIENGDALYFNGNIFRKSDTVKINKVLKTLKEEDRQKILSLNEQLHKNACIAVESATNLLGEDLLKKVISIGLYDINIVANSKEEVGFMTLPSAFGKYADTAFLDDAFDLAKAFLSSLSYGMTRSSYSRGNIRLVEALLNTLIAGGAVGPATAIGEDYQVLEIKGVVKVTRGSKGGRTGPMLKLLKKEV